MARTWGGERRRGAGEFHGEGFITDRDREVFARSNYGHHGSLTTPMVLLVIDVTLEFTGQREDTFPESLERWPNSCGPESWEAVSELGELLPNMRELGVPIVYTVNASEYSVIESATWGRKRPRVPEQASEANEIPGIIEPRSGDLVIRKVAPSAFFGTPLASYLVAMRAQQLVVCGATTSGCVRATVVDGFSYGYSVAVVEECTFDRGEASHAVSLFDMEQKYANVVTSDVVREVAGTSLEE